MITNTEKLKILSQIFGSFYKSGDEYLFYCPVCKHHKQKLSINLKKDKSKCWICAYSTSNINSLIKRFASQQLKDKWFDLTGQIDLSSKKDLFSGEKEEIQEIINLPNEFVSLTSNNLPFQGKIAKNYLLGRGIKEEDIHKYKAGYCPSGEYEERIIIPSFGADGKVNYFVGRTYTEKFPKYKNPKTNKNIIFNELLVDWNSPITLVEGTFDAIKAGENSIPVLGSTLREDTKLFSEIINHSPDIYFAFDPDAIKKELKIIKIMLKYNLTIYKVNVDPYEDVGSMPYNIFQERKKEARKIDNNFILKYKMEKVW